jgi:hypothetical protein
MKLLIPAPSARYADALLRSVAALLGGYAASFALVFGAARALAALGLERADAAALPAMASFLVWLALGLYAFGARSALRAWLLPLGLIALALAIAGLLPGRMP